MKKWLLASVVALYLLSCKKECTDENNTSGESITNHILMLQVSFVDYEFQGGKEFNFSTNVDAGTIPIAELYDSPGDFGSSLLTFIPTGDSLFYGSIVWMGEGLMHFPADISPNFSTSPCITALPDTSQFQRIGWHAKHTTLNNSIYENMWNAISNLNAIEEYNSQSKVGIYLYQPSVGVGNPNDWSWFLFFYK